MNKKVLVSLLIVLSIIATGCSKKDPKAKLEDLKAQYNSLAEQIRVLEDQIESENPKDDKGKLVEVKELVKESFTKTVTVQGIVDGDRVVSLFPRAQGQVVYLNAKVGQMVTAGETLLTIDNSILIKQRNEIKTSLDFATDVYNRQAKLWADSVGSEIQYLQAKNNKESLENRLASLNEQIALYTLKAPSSGVIQAVNVKQSETASMQTPAIVLADLSVLKLKINVSDSYSTLVRKGDMMNVFFPDLNKNYDLRITSVSDVIDPKNRTFAIEATLPNNMAGVKANMLAQTDLEIYKNPSTIAIPINIIQRDNATGEYVWVAKQDSASGQVVADKRSIKRGEYSSDLAEITSGLEAGDKIITTGFQSLSEGEILNVK